MCTISLHVSRGKNELDKKDIVPWVVRELSVEGLPTQRPLLQQDRRLALSSDLLILLVVMALPTGGHFYTTAGGLDLGEVEEVKDRFKQEQRQKPHFC